MNYTKGEWLNHEILVESKVMGNTYKSIALIVPTGNNEEAMGNARLIAAAPDMYESLKLLAKSYDIDLDTKGKNLEYYGEDWQALIKVLAKAEGEK